MSKEFSKEIRSNVTSDGNIEISIASVEKPVPAENEVLIKVEASPINPSDLGLLISFAADLDSLNVSGSGDETVAKMKVHPGLMKAMTPRLDQSMKVGNEGGGVIEDAGTGAIPARRFARDLLETRGEVRSALVVEAEVTGEGDGVERGRVDLRTRVDVAFVVERGTARNRDLEEGLHGGDLAGRNEDPVDQVDDAVRGGDVGGLDDRFVDEESTAGGGEGEVGPGEGFDAFTVDEVAGLAATGDHVVLEDADERGSSGVGEQAGERFLTETGERRVGRGEDGQRSGAREGFGETGGLHGGDQRVEPPAGDGGLGNIAGVGDGRRGDEGTGDRGGGAGEGDRPAAGYVFFDFRVFDCSVDLDGFR